MAHKRTRGWRRWKKENIIIRRLKYNSYSGVYHDANKNKIQCGMWINLIGTKTHYMCKTYTTDKWTTRYKSKYRCATWSDEYNTRIKQKRLFKKMLYQDYGIKHLNISYGFI